LQCDVVIFVAGLVICRIADVKLRLSSCSSASMTDRIDCRPADLSRALGSRIRHCKELVAVLIGQQAMVPKMLALMCQ
jgi:hypothetical protein